jgi:predicted XRE-type DNA-binding protein
MPVTPAYPLDDGPLTKLQLATLRQDVEKHFPRGTRLSREELFAQKSGPVTASDDAGEGSANVYADLGYPNASEMQRKSSLVAEISRAIQAGRLNHDDAARLLEVGSADLAGVLRGHFRNVDESLIQQLVERLVYIK